MSLIEPVVLFVAPGFGPVFLGGKHLHGKTPAGKAGGMKTHAYLYSLFQGIFRVLK
jgi:hypothetical protein